MVQMIFARRMGTVSGEQRGTGLDEFSVIRIKCADIVTGKASAVVGRGKNVVGKPRVSVATLQEKGFGKPPFLSLPERSRGDERPTTAFIF
jgi:hypothetical protein